MQFIVLDDAFETIVAEEMGELLLEQAEGEIMGSEEGKAGIGYELAEEWFGAVGFVFGIGATEDLVDEDEDRPAFLYMPDDPLQLFELRHEIGSLFLQGIADAQGGPQFQRGE